MTYTIKAKEMLMDQESSHSVQNGARKPLGHPISHKVVIFVLSLNIRPSDGALNYGAALQASPAY